MGMSNTNNKTIAKNAFFLYIRMGVMMLLSLYTARVVLNTLGIEDYGIFNVVSGVTIAVSFLTNSLSTACQRFITFALGRNDDAETQKVFCMGFNCILISSAILVVLFETVGLWFLNNQLNIPADRMTAANWIFQFSILSFLVRMLVVPYNASIIAYERMSFYAYTSIIDAVLKLLVIYVLLIGAFDKLILYGILQLLVSIVVFLVYKIYCSRAFKTTTFKPVWEKSLFRNLIGFTGWNVFGAFSNITIQQAVIFLVNIFIGVTGNATMGLATSVSTTVNQFVTNFQTAFRPSIIKLYAQGNTSELHKLAFRSSSFSYYLLLIVAVPIIFNLDDLLKLWLGNVPPHVAGLIVLFIVYELIDAIQAPTWMIISASGNIRTYSLFTGILFILNFPIVWVALLMGCSIYWVVGIRVILNLVTAIIRTVYVQKVFDFPSIDYVRSVVKKALVATVVSVFICYIIQKTLFQENPLFILQAILYFLLTAGVIWLIGLSKSEKQVLVTMAKSKIKKSHGK